MTQPDRSDTDALGRRRRHGRLTGRTISVRLGDDDYRRLLQLKEALAGAERGSYVENELRGVRGRHVAYDAPLSEGQVVRYALKLALERLPVDGMTRTTSLP